MPPLVIDTATVVELVRARLNIQDGRSNVRIIWSIPHALERLARKVAANPRKRPLLLTNQENVVMPLANGACDLTTLLSRVLVEYLHVGNIFYVGADVPDETRIKQFPIQPVAASQANAIADHPLNGSYLFYWLDGQTLRVLDYEIGNPLAGELRFAVPFVPTLDELTFIPELHDDLVEKVIELVLSPASDAAEDAEH